MDDRVLTKNSKHILVVDDSRAILIVMQAILTELKVTDITLCSDANEALQKVIKADQSKVMIEGKLKV